MNSGMTPRTITLVFLSVLALYFGSFHGLEYLRTYKGPWEVQFAANPGSAPVVSIRQSHLGVDEVKLVFHGESVPLSAQPAAPGLAGDVPKATNATPALSPNGSVRFDAVEKPARFGEVIYEDLTFLPGVVTFNLFGHEIELMPRVLVVNKREIPWQSGTTVDLWPSNRPPVAPAPPKGSRSKATGMPTSLPGNPVPR